MPIADGMFTVPCSERYPAPTRVGERLVEPSRRLAFLGHPTPGAPRLYVEHLKRISLVLLLEFSSASITSKGESSQTRFVAHRRWRGRPRKNQLRVTSRKLPSYTCLYSRPAAPNRISSCMGQEVNWGKLPQNIDQFVILIRCGPVGFKVENRHCAA